MQYQPIESKYGMIFLKKYAGTYLLLVFSVSLGSVDFDQYWPNRQVEPLSKVQAVRTVSASNLLNTMESNLCNSKKSFMEISTPPLESRSSHSKLLYFSCQLRSDQVAMEPVMFTEQYGI